MSSRRGTSGRYSSVSDLPRDDRAVSTVVGKTLEIGIGVMVVALLASTLYGGVVPTYRTVAGDELGDRALARAAATAEGAVPPAGVTVAATASASLPPTIRGATYEIHATNGTLTLRHPHPGVRGSVELSVPDRVGRIQGTWRSTDPFRVAVTGTRTDVTITIGGTA